LPARALTAGTP